MSSLPLVAPRSAPVPASACGARGWWTRRLALAVAGVVAVLAALVATPASPASAAVPPATAEMQFLLLVNEARAAAGLSALVHDAPLAVVARDWSTHMAGVYATTGDPVIKPEAPTNCQMSSLCHRPDLADASARIEPRWARAAENIGYGNGVGQLHNAFMASPGHKANVLGPYNRVGIGVVQQGSTLWVTLNFLSGPTIQGPTALDYSMRVAPPLDEARVTPIGPPTRYNPFDPKRIVDTRSGVGVAGEVGAGGVARIEVVRNGHVPAEAEAVVLNITATDARGSGFLTAYPCGSARPNSSTVNVKTGQTAANQAVVALDGTAAVCVYSMSATHLVVDLAGWYGELGAGYHAASPRRLLDSRAIGGRAQRFTVPVSGLETPGISAVAVNLTVTQPAAAGFLTAYACDVAQPLASNVNFVAGQTVANLATVVVGPSRQLCLASNVPVHVVVDLAGTFGIQGQNLTASVPIRLLDTREATGGWIGRAGTLQRVELSVGGARNIPAMAKAVAMNLTVTSTSASGYVVAHPCDQPMPVASNVNFTAGGTVANSAIVRLPTDGKVCITSNVQTHVIADVMGWYTT